MWHSFHGLYSQKQPGMPLKNLGSFILLLAFFACKEAKVKTVADADITIADFIELAPVVNLPYIINDSVLNKKKSDSSVISIVKFQEFVPDTVFKKYFPQTKNLKLYLLGKSTDDRKGNYLFIKSVSGKKNEVWFFYFTNKAIYLSSMRLADNLPMKSGNRYCKIDNKHSISFIKEQRTPTGEYWTSETIYYMDASGKMIVAMTNSGEDLSDEIMGNPIDTLPRKNKFSADYYSDKKNMVSIRDGASAKTFHFFIHFSKQNGECVGELKGEGEFTSTTKGVFHDDEGACEIIFNFSTGSISIKETNGCGNYRDITCFFEGSFTRKKEAVKPKTKKKK